MQQHQTFAAILFLASASLIGCESAKSPLPVPPRPPVIVSATPAAPEQRSTAQEAVAKVASEPQVTESAEQVAKDYLANQGAADIKYQRKLVRIDGKIRKLEIDKDGLRTIVLDGDGGLDIHCVISSESWTQYNSLKVDQDVSLIGDVFGFIGNAVRMDEAQIEQ